MMQFFSIAPSNLADSVMKLLQTGKSEDTRNAWHIIRRMLEKKSKTESLEFDRESLIESIRNILTHNEDLSSACWSGYKAIGTKEKNGKTVPNCVPEETEKLEEAEYQGRSVELNKPFRTPGGPKKFAVYVKNEKGNVIKLGFGDPNMEIKRDDPNRRSNYRARHHCSDPGPKWKANYWSCKMWSSTPVSKLTK